MWNPLRHLTDDNRYYSYTKILVSSWWGRCLDGFYALYGSYNGYTNIRADERRVKQFENTLCNARDFEDELRRQQEIAVDKELSFSDKAILRSTRHLMRHGIEVSPTNAKLGLLDIWVFPRLMSALIFYIMAEAGASELILKNNALSWSILAGLYVLDGIQLILDLPKLVISTVITLAVLPLISLVHLISQPIINAIAAPIKGLMLNFSVDSNKLKLKLNDEDQLSEQEVGTNRFQFDPLQLEQDKVEPNEAQQVLLDNLYNPTDDMTVFIQSASGRIMNKVTNESELGAADKLLIAKRVDESEHSSVDESSNDRNYEVLASAGIDSVNREAIQSMIKLNVFNTQGSLGDVVSEAAIKHIVAKTTLDRSDTASCA